MLLYQSNTNLYQLVVQIFANFKLDLRIVSIF